jgi:MFS family permease
MTTNLRQAGRSGPSAPTLAIAGVFFVNGCTFSSWVPRLPELQQRLDISDAALGFTLVGMGIGGLAASAVSGKLVERFGSRTMTVATSIALSVGLPLLGLAPTAGAVFAVLIVLGALDGLTDVAMNSQALELQQRRDRSIISRFHALWSLGAVTGGVVASRAAAAGLSLRVHLLIVAGVLVLTTALAARWLLPDTVLTSTRDATDAPERARTRGVLLTLFVLGVGIALIELPPNDWAALLMDDRFEISEGAAALGFVATATGMFIGRLLADPVTDAVGAERTRRGGALLAALGVVAATTVPTPQLATFGLFFAGLGVAGLFPLAFRAAAELGAHTGMAAFSSGARLGFLVASPLVGVIAGATSVATAVLVVSGTAGVAVGLTRLPAGGAVTPPA